MNPVQVQIWMSLSMPPQQQELFQVTAELVTEDGKVAARSTRPYLPRRHRRALGLARLLLTLPFSLFLDDAENVQLQLFDRWARQSNLMVRGACDACDAWDALRMSDW